jgi:hypothetical protein
MIEDLERSSSVTLASDGNYASGIPIPSTMEATSFPTIRPTAARDRDLAQYLLCMPRVDGRLHGFGKLPTSVCKTFAAFVSSLEAELLWSITDKAPGLVPGVRSQQHSHSARRFVVRTGRSAGIEGVCTNCSAVFGWSTMLSPTAHCGCGSAARDHHFHC